MISIHSVRSVMRGVYDKEMVLDPDNVPALYALLQKAEARMNGDDPAPWAREEVAVDIAAFADHELLSATQRIAVEGEDGHEILVQEAGGVRHGIAPDSDFVNYLQEYSAFDKASFDKMMYNVFKLLYLSASVDPDARESFFYSFPPVGEEELRCMAGSIARFESIFNTLKDKTVLEEAFYQCHENDVMPVLNQRAIEHFDDYYEDPDHEYHVHVPEYLKYMLSFRNAAQSAKVDGNYYLIADMLTLATKVDLFESYGRVFNEKIMANRADPLFLQDWSQKELEKQIEDIVDRVNKFSSADLGNAIPEEFDIYSVNFNEYFGADSAQCKARIAVVIVELARLMNTDPEEFLDRYCDRSVATDINADGEPNYLYKINPESLQQGFRDRQVANFDRDFNAMQGLGFDVDGYENKGRMLEEEICSDSIIYELSSLLGSGDINKVKSAISILQLFADSGSSAPALHFYNVISSPDCNPTIYEMLDGMSRGSADYQFCYEDPEFRSVYLEKILSPVDNRGILSQFDIVKDGYRDYIQLSRSSGLMPANTVAENLEQFSTQQFMSALDREDVLKTLVHSVDDLMAAIDQRVDSKELFKYIAVSCDPWFLEICVEDSLASFIDFITTNILQDEFITPGNINALLYAAIDGGISGDDFNTLMQREGFDINYKATYDNTFLHKVVRSGNLEIAEAILDSIPDGCDIDAFNDEGGSALGELYNIEAKLVRPSHIAIAKVMIEEYSADIHCAADEGEAQDFIDWVVLSDPAGIMFAQKAELINIILDDEGVRNIGIRSFKDCPNDSEPLTSLVKTYNPITAEHLEVARKFIMVGSDIAAIFDSPAITIDQKVAFVDSLKGFGYDFNTLDSLDNTPLLSAIQHPDLDQAIKLTKVLLANGADPNVRYADTGSGYNDALSEAGMVNLQVNSEVGYQVRAYILFQELVHGGAYINDDICDSISAVHRSENGNVIHIARDTVERVVQARNHLRENFSVDQLEELINKYYQGNQVQELEAKLLLTYRNEDGSMELVHLFNNLRQSSFSNISSSLKEAMGRLIEEYQDSLPEDFPGLYQNFSTEFDDFTRAVELLVSLSAPPPSPAPVEATTAESVATPRKRALSQIYSPTGDSGVDSPRSMQSSSPSSGGSSPSSDGSSPELKRARSSPGVESPNAAAQSIRSEPLRAQSPESNLSSMQGL